VVAAGQTTDISGSGSILGFPGGSAWGPDTGTATITHTDGSAQQFTLGFGDWASTSPYPGSQVAVTSAYGDTASGTSPWTASVFYDAVTLEAGRTVQSVTCRPAAALRDTCSPRRSEADRGGRSGPPRD
jgi:beta-glucosidase